MKNNRQTIFIIDQNCMFSGLERPSFLSYDTGVSHKVYETKQFRESTAGCVPALNLNRLFWHRGRYNRLYMSGFH